MDIKSIVVPVTGAAHNADAVSTALALGRLFEANVVGLHAAPDPRMIVQYLGEGMTGQNIEAILDAAVREAKERSDEAKALFDKACASWSVTMTAPGKRHGGATAEWHDETGRETDVISAYGGIADLLVVGRPETGLTAADLEFFDAALFHSGKPVLMAARAGFETKPASIMIAWNGGLEASRAVAHAMPFLQSAERVSLVTAGDNFGRIVSRDQLTDYFALHGVKVTLERIDEAGEADDGAALLDKARDLGAEIIVMGAYSHSRLRETIFGGVTTHMLEESDIPLFMHH